MAVRDMRYGRLLQPLIRQLAELADIQTVHLNPSTPSDRML